MHDKEKFHYSEFDWCCSVPCWLLECSCWHKVDFLIYIEEIYSLYFSSHHHVWDYICTDVYTFSCKSTLIFWSINVWDNVSLKPEIICGERERARSLEILWDVFHTGTAFCVFPFGANNHRNNRAITWQVSLHNSFPVFPQSGYTFSLCHQGICNVF